MATQFKWNGECENGGKCPVDGRKCAMCQMKEMFMATPLPTRAEPSESSGVSCDGCDKDFGRGETFWTNWTEDFCKDRFPKCFPLWASTQPGHGPIRGIPTTVGFYEVTPAERLKNHR